MLVRVTAVRMGCPCSKDQDLSPNVQKKAARKHGEPVTLEIIKASQGALDETKKAIEHLGNRSEATAIQEKAILTVYWALQKKGVLLNANDASHIELINVEIRKLEAQVEMEQQDQQDQRRQRKQRGQQKSLDQLRRLIETI